MKPCKANQFVCFVDLVCDSTPTSKHTTDNLNKLKSLRDGYCKAMNESRPEILLQYWSVSKDEECESIEVLFDDGSIVKLESDHFVLFEDKE